MRAWREKNREHVRAYNYKYSKEYYRRNPEKFYFWQVKNRAERLGIPFDLTEDDLAIPETCPILGIPLVRNVGQNGPSPCSPSVDRLDPTKGYTKGNVWIISQRANVMKNDASIEELRKFASWVNQLTI